MFLKEVKDIASLEKILLVL